MKSKGLRWMAHIGVVLAISIGAVAQTPNPVHFRGTINDFTPANVGGPWQVSGTWSLKLNGDSGTADFSAALTMVRSDLGVTDLNSTAQRKAHTHHVILVGGTVTPIAGGFQVTGPVTITGNGTYPPPFGPSSTATINITGGNTVTFSNIQLILSGDAATHFGSQAINGVVHNVK
jgi:hypothetical protein